MADEPKVPTNRPPVGPKVVPEHDGGAFNDGHQPGAGAQQRGLPGAVRPGQKHHLADADVEVDARKGREASQQADGGAEVDGEAHAREARLPAAGSQPPRRPRFTSAFRDALGSAPPRTAPPVTAPLDPEQVAAEALSGASARAATAAVERPTETPSPYRRPDLAQVLSVTGRLLIALGLLIIGFVGFELLGTNLAEAADQADLKAELTVPPPPTDLATSQPVSGPAPPPPPEGSAIAQIRIPRIGVDKAVLEGVDLADLRKGPGHYKGTPLPGQPGNSAIAGHRTTYGAPFYRLDEMQPGDPIFVSTRQGAFRYEVRQTFVVKPEQVEVLAPTEGDQLTLTTCNPRFSAAQRLVVVADLKGPAAPGMALPVAKDPAVAASLAAAEAPVIGEVVGASGDPSERAPAALWGTVLLALGVAGAMLGRLWRRWPAWALASIPFVPALWAFYGHLARAIPS